MHWGGQEALYRDTQTVLRQTTQELMRVLQSRRGTLTFIRDAINRRPDLSLPQLQAIGASATQHTRHLLGTGLIRSYRNIHWWFGPESLSPAQLKRLNEAMVQWGQLPGVWTVPSTFVTELPKSRTSLVMWEPLRTSSYAHSAVIGAFNLNALLEDFVATRLSPHYPVEIANGEQPLFRSKDWRLASHDHRLITIEYRLEIDAVHLILRMQPGKTQIVQTLSWFNYLVIGLSLIAGLAVSGIVWMLVARTWILQRAVSRRTKALRRTLERLRQLATTDELTGLYNRRFFLDRFAFEYDRAKRYHRPLSCLMIDINGFKQVNDWLGHHAGDLVLKRVSGYLKPALRQSDILARLGGDEFTIILPETNANQATVVAEKLRRLRIPLPQGQQRIPPLSLSVGLSCLDLEGSAQTQEDLIQAADKSLYVDKERHRYTSATPMPHQPVAPATQF